MATTKKKARRRRRTPRHNAATMRTTTTRSTEQKVARALQHARAWAKADPLDDAAWQRHQTRKLQLTDALVHDFGRSELLRRLRIEILRAVDAAELVLCQHGIALRSGVLQKGEHAEVASSVGRVEAALAALHTALLQPRR